MRGCGLMPRKGITGHDEWVVTEALATALVALEQLPPKHQPRPHMEDIKKLLVAGWPPGARPPPLAPGKWRRFSGKEPPTTYLHYRPPAGPGWGQECVSPPGAPP